MNLSNGFLKYGTLLISLFGFLILFFVLGLILVNGWSKLSLSFIFMPSREFGLSGGIFFQLFGTVLLTVGAVLIALPLSFTTVLYKLEYMVKYRKWNKIISIVVYGFNAVPTIVFGLLGYLVFCRWFGLGVSWLSGCLILALMLLPTLMISLEESILDIPASFKDIAKALGFNKEQAIRAVIIPNCQSGIFTGVLIGIGRALGETAAIMFTATVITGGKIPSSIFEPVASIQTHILVLLQESYDDKAWQSIWAAALVLILLVFLVNLLSIFYRKSKRKV